MPPIYMSIMPFITIDRFLEFNLCIKYSLYWTSNKIVVTIAAPFAVFTTVFFYIFVLNRLKSWNYPVNEIVSLYAYVPVQGVFFSIRWLHMLQYFSKIEKE